MEEELVSIVVPIYNVEKYLEECIASILKLNQMLGGFDPKKKYFFLTKRAQKVLERVEAYSNLLLPSNFVGK